MALPKGCTIALIIAGIIAVLIVVLIIIVIANRDKLVDFSMNMLTSMLETEIVKNMPDGYTPESVYQILDDFKAAVKNGQVKPEQLQVITSIIQTILADKTVTKEEGALILGKLKEAIYTEPSVSPDSLPGVEQAVPDSV